jgi:predicted HTH domain antitoxin
MAVSFELDGLEDELRATYGGDLSRAARDALLIDAYRTGRISIGRLAAATRRSVAESMSWLADHQVGPNYTTDDIIQDRQVLASLAAKLPRP